MTWFECKRCKGKGHVLSPIALGAVGLGWFLAIVERNSPDGLSRDTCDNCDGEGVLWRDDK